MKKRSCNNKKQDFNEIAFQIMQKATTDGKNPAAVMLGRLGGLKGGKARASKLSKERRIEIARKAAISRWDKE